MTQLSAMVIWQELLLFVAAMLGGMLNSVAGGGSFFTFPALVFTGVPPIWANATSTVALWPGSAAGAAAYRNDFVTRRAVLLWLSGLSLIGGILGALLLLWTPQSTFVRLVPYLLLFATLLFTFSGQITARVRARASAIAYRSKLSVLGSAILHLAISTYGGYFGGGMGVMLLTALALMGMDNIHTMNALKNLLAVCINGVAVVTFVLAGAVLWPQALLMTGGAIVGGYLGGHQARKFPAHVVRRFVIVVGFVLSFYFFLKA